MYDAFVRDHLPLRQAQPDFLFDRPELQYPATLNAAVEIVDRAVAEGDGDRVAIVNDAGRWTYAELADLSARIARILVEDEGLVPGNRVLLRGPNNAMLFASWLGVLKAGGIAVTTMPILRAQEISAILAKARISHAIVDGRTEADFLPAWQASDHGRSLLTYQGDGGEGLLEQRIAQAAPGFPAIETKADDPALIAFTSGTTGHPKGCIQFHRDILVPNDTFARHILKPRRDDVFACSAPIAFTFGLGALLIFPLLARATALTIERPAPAALLAAAAQHGVTILLTAPTAYKEMLHQLAGQDLSALRMCVSAGEHLPEATARAWHEATGVRIIDGIGATEMMHIFISAAGDDIRPGATGLPVPGFEACILDDAGNPLSSGTGRLAVKGPCGCRYLDDTRQANYVLNGWNVTGDTYRLDAQGYFWYVSRSDDMIVSSGYNIGAPEVENALLAHPAVRECAVIGVPCDQRGQRVKAFIVTGDPAPPPSLAKELQDHVKMLIAPYKYPREIVFVAQLPKTGNGKLQRYALRDL
ncbi:AMP-binding protein [Sphingobium boeckii]|nr:AMP-binding protein [Sphingobium boeckii]